MAKQAFVKVNDLVDFTKNGTHLFEHLGKCVVVDINHGRVQSKYTVAVQTGPHAGTNRILTVRFSGPSNGELGFYCTIVGENKKVAAEKRKEKQDLQVEREVAAVKASQVFEAGDIVNIKSPRSDWNMKVLEVDFKKGRIYGVNAETHNPSSKRSWASLVHPEVKITMVKKGAFNPNTDSTVQAQKERAAAAGAKRTNTRQRRATLRSIYGF